MAFSHLVLLIKTKRLNLLPSLCEDTWTKMIRIINPVKISYCNFKGAKAKYDRPTLRYHLGFQCSLQNKSKSKVYSVT